MIFQIFGPDGVLRSTVSASSAVVAAYYLEEGDTLFEGGPEGAAGGKLTVVDGVLTRGEGVDDPADRLVGLGEPLVAVDPFAVSEPPADPEPPSEGELGAETEGES